MNCKIIIFAFSLVFISCDKTYETPDEIAEIEMEVRVKRFDQDFYNIKDNSFEKLKKEYPYFVPRNIANVDSLWGAKRSDTIEIELLEESSKILPNLNVEEADLELLFKHIKYYYPEFETPEVVALTTKVKYRSRVLLQNNILLVGIDCYLGADHKFYQDIPMYVSANFKKEQIVSDIAEIYANKYIIQGKQRQFIGQMVNFGKQLYLKDLFMPFKSEASRIGYTEEELVWAKANEAEIWSYFVEKDLLFSTDTSLSSRFIAQAPFSKFYLELDNESPGMLGRYLGWQIVRAYMEKNDVSLRELATIDGQELFIKSKYKPAK
ncbi:MAG: gliding motility lipoprotein GldB [Flavobacteriaceae bacterium]|nr:gliding motility lipoprotein GldB [Flavobacteriaceae bacterium]